MNSRHFYLTITTIKLKSYKYIFIFLPFTTLLVGIFLGNFLHSKKNSVFTETRQNYQYQFINPLLDCESSNFSENLALDPLKEKINNLIGQLEKNQQITFASLYYRDMNNGPWIAINENEKFSPASLIKVPLMVTYFKAAENNPVLLKQTIIATPSATEKQSIPPQISLVPNQSYTVEELINRMIIYSDNQAYDILNNFIDNRLLVKTFSDLGIDISQGYTDPSGNILSVKSYATFFRVLFNASYLNKDMSEKALFLLSKVKYQDGLVRGVNNPQIIISHKFGERTYENTGEKQLHDCGIVYLPQKPYLICIMTRGHDFSKLSSSISQISQLIYQSINLH